MTSSEEVDSIAHELSNIDFHHPFTPYTVQNQFMQTVYQILQTGEGQVGILESPTGTVGPFSCVIFRPSRMQQKSLRAEIGDSRRYHHARDG